MGTREYHRDVLLALFVLVNSPLFDVARFHYCENLKLLTSRCSFDRKGERMREKLGEGGRVIFLNLDSKNLGAEQNSFDGRRRVRIDSSQ